jgi:hypothetical protein
MLYRPVVEALRLTFFLASQQDEDRYRLITNPYWGSPESWVGMPFGTPADIWSFGGIVRVVPLRLIF